MRSARTRVAIVEAFLAMLRENGSVPTAKQLAARAGCSKRLIFERFADFKELGTAAFEHVLQQGLSRPVGDMPTRDRKSRIAFQVGVRAENCEKWLPLWRIMMRSRTLNEFATRIAVVRRMTRARIELMYAPELAALDPERREATVIALEALMDYEAWGRLREDHGLSFEQACSVWTVAVDLLLPATPKTAQAAESTTMQSVAPGEPADQSLPGA